MTNLEPDWKSLDQMSFVLQKRMIEHLNAALGAVNLIGTPEGGSQSLEFWQSRALRQIRRALNVYQAWALLAEYKNGQRMPSLNPLRAGDLLEWLASELHQTHRQSKDDDLLLLGNRETLQEALLLLYSAAYSLGPSVHLVTEADKGGMWFRVRYRVYRHAPATLDALLDITPDNWRAESTIFELQRARDFLTLNQCALQYRVEGNTCELSFYLPVSHPKAASSRRRMPATETAEMRMAQEEQITPLVGHHHRLSVEETRVSKDDMQA